MRYDLVLKNGFIVDGTGENGFYGDIAIKNNLIVKIDSEINGDTNKVIDCHKKVITPGFIDPHVHEEIVAVLDGRFEKFLKQGVTTTINGNCGHSITPYSSENVYEYMYKNGLLLEDEKKYLIDKNKHWDSFTEYCDLISKSGIAINMGFLLGHGTIRWSVMGGSKDRPPTEDEKREITDIINDGMKSGAFGISTGLAYIPSKYADIDELVEIAKLIKGHDGIYTSHIRDYIGRYNAVKETIEVGKKSGARVQVSHLSPVEIEAFDEILNARDNGVDIMVDTVPRSSGHCMKKKRVLQFIMAISSSLFELGMDGVMDALRNEEGRALILKEAFILGDRGTIILLNTNDIDMEKKSIREIAIQRGIDENKLLLDLLLYGDEELIFCLGGMYRGDFPDKLHDKKIIDNPFVMVGSDCLFSVGGDMSWFELQRRGAFPIFFEMYKKSGVRLEEVVRRVTSLPANQFKIKDRGILKEGKIADIVVIDMENYSYPRSEDVDFSNPQLLAKGVEYVIVNGKIALEEGKITKNQCGEVLKKIAY
ncbi:N-acyl-D-amino-acid deacylase family protein [Clostridioides difficile]|nr:D-aminoacylase [Clostridioides difficile]